MEKKAIGQERHKCPSERLRSRSGAEYADMWFTKENSFLAQESHRLFCGMDTNEVQARARSMH